jgi:hypothetical protein
MQLQTILYTALIAASVSLAAPARGGAGGGQSGPDGVSGAWSTNQMNEAQRLVGQITSQVEGQAYKPRTAAEAANGQRNFDPSHRFDLVNSGTPGRRDPRGGAGGGQSGPAGETDSWTTNQMNKASAQVGQITSATAGQAGERNWVGTRRRDPRGGAGGGQSGPAGETDSWTTNQMNKASAQVGQITSATAGQAGERNWVGTRRRDVDQAVPGNAFAQSVVNELTPAAKVAGTGAYGKHRYGGSGYGGIGYGGNGYGDCYPRGYGC